MKKFLFIFLTFLIPFSSSGQTLQDEVKIKW